jgi:hypothetical protein
MFVPLGDFNGGDFLGVATGVSDDGSDVVGYGQNGNDYFSYEAFRWTSTDGIGARCRPGRRLRQRRDERLRRRLDRGRVRQRLGNPRLSMDEQRRDAEARRRSRYGRFRRRPSWPRNRSPRQRPSRSPPLIANLALELAPIRVNLIAAGFVDTPVH